MGEDSGRNDLDEEDDSLLRAVAASLGRDTPIGPGTTLAQRFRVQRRLGSGGMGTVYEAVDVRDGGRVALKVLQSVSGDATHWLKREFRALADVHHPNLVMFHELFADERAWFFTMELVDGVPFLEYVRGPGNLAFDATVATDPSSHETRVVDLRTDAPLDEAKLRGTLSQLAAGVRAIHAAGKLHRDLKPSNVLVSSDGLLKVLDFGLAGEASNPGATQTVDKVSAGTPAYMAPEQFLGAKTTPASDWYAVGVMLFEALTGRLPFTGNVHAVIVAKHQSDAPRVHEIDSRAPADLAKLADELLQRQPEQRPDAESILARVGASTPTRVQASPATTPLPFVGRRQELDRLTDAYDRLRRQGQPSALLVGGVSGMGKSALIEEFLRGIEPGSLLLRGRCFQREAVPFNAFDSIADALAAHLAPLDPVEVASLLPRDVHSLTRLFPTLGRIEAVARARGRAPTTRDAIELQDRAFNALTELLLRLCDSGPLILVIDDLQWGDRDSAQLLNHLLQSTEPLSAVFVLAYRSDEVDSGACLPLLFDARASWRLRSVDLPISRLSATEAKQMAQTMLADDADAERIAAVSGGSPFFIAELCQQQNAEAAADLDQAVAARIKQLAPEAAQVLRVVAVAGRPLAGRVALGAAGLSAEQRGVLEQLMLARLLRPMGVSGSDLVETYHDRIRSAVEQCLSPEEQRQTHVELLAAYEQAGETDPSVLVRHVAGAGERERARQLALTHAEESLNSLAFERAATLLAIAADNTDDPSLRWPLRVRQADALCDAGYSADAARVFLSASKAASPIEALELRRRAAQLFLGARYFDEGLEVARPLCQELGVPLPRNNAFAVAEVLTSFAYRYLRGFPAYGPAPNRREEIRAELCFDVATGSILHDPILSNLYGARFARLTASFGTPAWRARAMAMHVAALPGLVYESAYVERQYDQVRELCEQSGDTWLLGGHLIFGRALVSSLDGNLVRGLQHAEEGLKLLREECRGVSQYIAVGEQLCRNCLINMGELNRCVERMAPVRRAAERRGDQFALLHCRMGIQFLDHLRCDDPDEAESCVPDQDGSVTDVYHFVNGIQLSLYRGTSEGWPGRYSAAARPLRLVKLFGAQIGYSFGLAALAEPQPDLRLARSTHRTLDNSPHPFARPMATALKAGLSNAAGHRHTCIALLERAADEFDAIPMKLHAAACRYRAGVVRGGTRGDAMMERGEAAMREEQVVNPSRFSCIYAPAAGRRT